MAKEYIAREAALDALKKAHNPNIVGFVTSKLAIDSTPAADVQPVVRGEWRYKTMSVPGGKGQTYAKWACTECGAKVKERSNYCPSCGARMGDGDNG